MWNLEPISDREQEDAEDHLRGLPCPACGRPDDWLAEGRDGRFVICRCDDCMGAVVRAEVAR